MLGRHVAATFWTYGRAGTTRVWRVSLTSQRRMRQQTVSPECSPRLPRVFCCSRLYAVSCAPKRLLDARLDALRTVVAAASAVWNSRRLLLVRLALPSGIGPVPGS